MSTQQEMDKAPQPSACPEVGRRRREEIYDPLRKEDIPAGGTPEDGAGVGNVETYEGVVWPSSYLVRL